MQMQGHHYKRHPKGMKKQGTSMAALNEVYTQHHGVFSTGATINGGPPPMLNMLQNQVERPMFIGAQLDAIKRKNSQYMQYADLRDEVGDDEDYEESGGSQDEEIQQNEENS